MLHCALVDNPCTVGIDGQCLHVGVGVGRLVNIGLADNEEDLDPC